MPIGAATFSEALRWGAETYHALKGIFEKRDCRPRSGTKAASRRTYPITRRPSKYWSKRFEATGRTPGTDVAIAMDPAASEFYRDGVYRLDGEGRTLSSGRTRRLLGRPLYSLSHRVARRRYGRR